MIRKLEAPEYVFRASPMLFTVAMVACALAISGCGGGVSGPADMVSIKGGCFDMGDTFGDGLSDEKPVHKVCLDDFRMDNSPLKNPPFSDKPIDH